MDLCDRPYACPHRVAAVARGDFIPNLVHGWVWRYAIRPNKPWLVCPWCGRELPSMQAITERVVYGVWHDTFDGENGG